MAGEIFISYRRADQAKARLLHALLKQRGVDAWYDALLDAGDDWRHKTAHALEAAPIFVLLFSKTASESDDISKELAAATFSKKLVIPVRIENIKPSGAFLYELASRNWVDAFEDTEAKFEDLADKLAALVKGGADAEVAAAKLGAVAPVIVKKRASKISPIAIGVMALVALAIVGVTLIALSGNDDRPPSPPRPPGSTASGDMRVAFFGFTATGDDPAVASAVTTATEEGYRMLDLTHVDSVLREEATRAGDVGVLERAGQLGARLLVTGEIRREGELLKGTVRLVDIPTRTTLVQRTLDMPVASPAGAAYRLAPSVATMPRCVINYVRSSKAITLDASTLTVIGRTCVSDLNGATNTYRELVKKLPDNAMAHARLAEALVWNIATVPEAQRGPALAEADKAVARAEALAPDAFQTAISRVSVNVAHNRPPAEWLPAFEQALLREPSGDEFRPYGQASSIVGQMLLDLGRTRDAARYFAQAMVSDPNAWNSEYYYAVAREASGQYGAKEALDRLVQTRALGYSWEVALTAAIFLKATDPETVLKATPADAVSAVPCYRELIASLKKTDTQARLAGAKKADVCLMNFDSPHVNIQAQSMLGNLDRAFEIVDRPDYTAFIWNYWSPLFMPSTKAMREDPRFLPLMQKLGYVDYWKRSKTQPDVCAADERDIPLCRALRGG